MGKHKPESGAWPRAGKAGQLLPKQGTSLHTCSKDKLAFPLSQRKHKPESGAWPRAGKAGQLLRAIRPGQSGFLYCTDVH